MTCDGDADADADADDDDDDDENENEKEDDEVEEKDGSQDGKASGHFTRCQTLGAPGLNTYHKNPSVWTRCLGKNQTENL